VTLRRACRAAVLAAILAACGGPEGPDAGQEAERAVLGSWAAEVAALGAFLRLEVQGAPARRYQAEIRVGADLVEREAGQWAIRSGRFHMVPETCEAADAAGDPLHLVRCGGPDSLALNISGDAWPVHLDAGGQLVTVTFYRL